MNELSCPRNFHNEGIPILWDALAPPPSATVQSKGYIAQNEVTNEDNHDSWSWVQMY